MKKYLLFAGDDYYPEGGWNDFKGDFDTALLARQAINDVKADWFQIIDRDTKEPIEENYIASVP